MNNVDIPEWLERMPLAPEFRPTDTEFADPIAYISKIEKEASAFGICKIIPPFPRPSRKYVLHNLNKSLSKCPELGADVNLVTSGAGNKHDKNVDDWKNRAVFTTRHQELGSEKGKKMKGVTQNPVLGAQKQVWQSGEVYTLEQFEAKSKNFARSLLGTLKEVDPLIVEAMFWKASSEKPIYIEYANDVPGSGFSEPVGFMQYFNKCRRRRKRNSFDRKNLSSEIDSLTSVRPNKDSAIRNNPNLSTKIVPDASSSVQNDANSSSEMEGTAGWKLANSRWNLQVIARSPGSLTRFMPDDIPGVTSPMVYIGMLFSWFAWHVEDHELHSLNFLHMGYPKTWYSVPGDCAFKFEEIIRHQAYGETTDRLAALSRLGQKTTVLSPEVFSALGIPCCRLVQNPGEFVVTFPRAYHIGFSHGFNCGEAANFGTPKWLSLAKEAAVRRAAMNFLPMLSHQQLLYLLTMSFISRIPRCLLPGVRSSRSRDRQKEDRELLVKRAFIEDILNENHRVTLLLQRNSSHRAVLWDAESLPSYCKESELAKDLDAVKPSSEKVHAENDESMDVSQLSTYISSVGFDLNDDDLAYDFKMDSGTLPCVACGVLGFPFMAVVQPSVGASKNLLLKDAVALSVKGSIEGKANLNKENFQPSKEASSSLKLSQSTFSSLEESLAIGHALSKYEAGTSKVEIAKGWNDSDFFLKPRVFCMEHAIQIEELLSFKGGANILVICHSDFQKLKAHAAIIAEEIGTRFCYNEIPLGIASQEDLNLVDIAIGCETQVDCADWTSQLSVNLQHCVKVKKDSPAKKVEYLLALGGLFCEVAPISNTSRMQWLSRKSRSKRNLKHLLLAKPSSSGIKKSKEDSKSILVYTRAKKEVKIIQYSRKRYKFHGSSGREAPRDAVHENLATNDKTLNVEIPILVDDDNNFPSESQVVASSQAIVNSEPEVGVCEMNNPIVEELADESTDKNEGYDSENHCSVSNEIERDSDGESVLNSTEQTLDENDQRMESNTQSNSDDSTPSSETSNHSRHNSSESESHNSSESESHNSSEAQSDSDDSKIETSNHSGHNSLESEGQIDDNSQESPISSSSSKTSKNDSESSMAESEAIVSSRNKRKKDEDTQADAQIHFTGFTKSPCEGLRPRARKDSSCSKQEETQPVKKLKKASSTNKGKKKHQKEHYKCDIHTCNMRFHSKGDLAIHKRNRCTFEGCGKKFSTHTSVVRHQRVHDDDRPLKCPWKGCKMAFKWHWSRTEHVRLHTGERPYACKIEGCGLTFRYVSDFGRHRRKTGHYVDSS